MKDGLPELPKIPDGWVVFPGAGWYPNEEVERVQAGALLLPRFFHLGIGHSGEPPWVAMLFFMVNAEEEISLRRVEANGLDVHEALAVISETHTIADWSRVAIAGVVLDELRETVGLPEEMIRKDPDDYVKLSKWVSEHIGGVGAGLAADRDRTAEIMRQAQHLSAPGKRTRVTTEHLRKVAQVYRDAHAHGRPPTQAVADEFATSHSTAARWVGLARRREFLPPTQPGKGEA